MHQDTPKLQKGYIIPYTILRVIYPFVDLSGGLQVRYQHSYNNHRMFCMGVCDDRPGLLCSNSALAHGEAGGERKTDISQFSTDISQF
jgi:hypothetical protein